VDQRHPFLTGTKHTASALAEELGRLTSNDTHDYVFAHLLLPHEPVLVDSDCAPLSDPVEVFQEVALRRAGLSGQMDCVDRLVSEALTAVDADTAVLLTGDHGTGTTNQVGRPPEEWSDAGVAERFGVFLAHRLPTGCQGPDLADPMSAMAAIMTCAVDAEFPVAPPIYMIGDQDPVAVDPDRMDRIKAAVAAGTLLPDAG
jgi:hypothetical protein